ncbi:PDGLE domain-containing protein [Halegenticoccus soli]|uniref:PDGLE domain-containing protein n=1 Tax=Halegenticoccus soli TaxID=1985678 RepID=UPI000C6CBD0C|nr:PDGLE domain-containing protein [Halegenticoccus soli]
MTGVSFARRGWSRRALLGVLVLVALSPAFAWGADAVGYAEPLDNAAEATGATAAETTINPGAFPEYSVSGVGPYLGTLLAGIVGTGLTFAAAAGLGRALRTD